MNLARQPASELETPPGSHSELLILPDGRILVHNLTRTMAAVLRELNPADDTIRPRAEAGAELPNAGQIVA